jgi:hypothetical protein
MRRAAAERAVERLGSLEPDDEAPRSDSPAHLAWWLRGPRGRLRVELLATSEPVPRMQALWLEPVPDPPPALSVLAGRIATLLEADSPRWPDDVATAPGTDLAALERGLRAAALRLGAVTLGRPVAGDGERALTVEVLGARGRGRLRVEVDDAGAVSRAVVAPAPAAAPAEAP